MMTKQQVNSMLATVLRLEPETLDAPTMEDWDFLRVKFQTDFPEEFVYFIEAMSEYSFPGEILNVRRLGRTNGNDTIDIAFEFEKSTGRWHDDLIPFYSVGNGDYFCLKAGERKTSGVYYYFHEDGRVEQQAVDFGEWLRQLPEFLNA